MRTTHLVVKVASRCNLNCTYCYMYNMGDDSYKSQPKFMSKHIVKSMLVRIKKHCIENNLTEFLIIFHGGEPLLAGIIFFKDFINLVDQIIPKTIEMSYTMQSNGVLIDKKICEELSDLGIGIGISLDGTSSSNNKNRIYHNGKGSYNEIIKGSNFIKEVYGKEYSDFLCVIDTDEKPKDVYEHFKKLEAHSVHFLFQDFNYILSNQNSVPKIGSWLVEMFNLWYEDQDLKKPEIRPLNDLIGLILGLDKNSENFGKGINDTLVIETNGSIETVDTLRICGNGFTKTKFNVIKDELSAIYQGSELARKYYNGHDNLCRVCNNCSLESICGGGYLGHRFSPINQFDNPSIYCKEIVEIICHIQNQLLKELPSETIKELKVEALNYYKIINEFIVVR
ncbi:radical SAM protein [Flavobacterium psychroterrae]|uniref:Radical SAM protein n=1 Tax=Flavobacterium psychroterrae TaxID=2133767 RepID=A0ABS5P8L9_9FLAO|nr:radical SAM protein [Flavobacterium psychroterrae]MBS7230170.1 radical SAM protein [Flavobacterium psychroterrae]